MFIDFFGFLFFREKGSVWGAGWEKETWAWERNINQLPPICARTWDGTHNLGMRPDQESNLQPFGVWDHAPTNWATWPGLK